MTYFVVYNASIVSEQTFQEDDRPLEFVEQWSKCQQASQLYLRSSPCWPDGATPLPPSTGEESSELNTESFDVTVIVSVNNLLKSSSLDSVQDMLTSGSMELKLTVNGTETCG